MLVYTSSKSFHGGLIINDLFKTIPVTKIFGTAGAGKTTKLINILEELFKQGVQPERVVFASFTKKAVEEMIERVLIKFPKFDKRQFKNFKTIHALGYASNNKKIITPKELFELAKSLGLEISYHINQEDGGGAKMGDQVVTIESLSRLRMVSLEDQWYECCFDDVPLYLAKDWQNALNKFKKDNNKADFTDLLEGYNGSALDADYMIVDEAQDLCPLQWKVLDDMSKNCKRVYIAGDDDQLIYKWAGADVNFILNIKKEEEIVLAKSHRMPSNIYNLSRSVLKKIRNRKPKDCKPTKADGKIDFVDCFEDIDFDIKQEYLILIRNKYQSAKITERLQQNGLHYSCFGESSTNCDEIKAVFAWERFRKNKTIDYKDYGICKQFSTHLKFDRDEVPDKLLTHPWFDVLNLVPRSKSDYFREMLSKGFKLNQEPKIKVSTIHQAKGGECKNVILIMDVSANTYKNIDSDDEHRVWYVAISRAKQNLTIVRSQTLKYYEL